jgi:hypothetical protein
MPYLSSSPLVDDGPDESPECVHEGAVGAGAGLGEAQLGANGAGPGAAVGLGAAGLGAAGLDATGLDAAGLGAAGLAAAGLAAGAAFFLAGLFLALAFLADFFGAAALAFLADFLADFLAFFADFFEDFFADFFFAVRSFFLFFLSFLPFFFFPLAIIILLLPPIHVYRAFRIVRLRAGPIDQFDPGRGPPVAQSRSSIVCTTGTDVPPAICTMHPILPAAIMSGLTDAILATFRSRNLLAMSGWRML